MLTIAYHTLGCKVNQYDTQAMEELLSEAGYSSVPFPGPADIYLLNTCTVTGTGDRKSLQLMRRLKRDYPGCRLIVCGCLAQLQGDGLLKKGADLVLGTQRRGEIVHLLSSVLSSGQPVCAVEPLTDRPVVFEPLSISRQSGHTRAVMKIQEGCMNHCSYCIIPQVRGPIRSRSLQDIREEARRLSEAGFCEIVLTGIHLSSYGRDFSDGSSLLDAVRVLQETDGILRIRLGSLEPTIATPAFSSALKQMDKICPQFHLALQSGSDSVLQRMQRRYNTRQYLDAVENIRNEFPLAAITTDILTGFPGETEEEFRQTMDMIRKVGFSRIHVFPYSPRPNTKAAAMPGQLSDAERQRRARVLIAIGEETAAIYRARWLGNETVLLPEEMIDGAWEGYSPEYIRIRLRPDETCVPGIPVQIRIVSVNSQTAVGVKI